MKNLPQIFIMVCLIVIFTLLFFYLYFLKADILRLKGMLKDKIKKGDIIIYFPDWEKNDILSLDGLPIIVSQERHYLNLYGFDRMFIIKNTKTFPNQGFPILNEVAFTKRFSVGRYTVEEYKLPLWNFSSVIDNLNVLVSDVDGKRTCQKDIEKKYKCGDMGWQYVGLVTVDINGQFAECIWAHPIGGKNIIIETELPFTLYGKYIVYTALASTSGFDSNKPEIVFSVFINNKKVFSSSIHRQREWLKDKFEFREEKGKAIRIEIFSPQEYKNHFCFNIEAF
ncbi:MAG: hypothetical protein N2746_05630 [Deltaproteobacteria bacterium]|nr:hypothetical protein [Deltaproteobacteria bacterium]